MVVVFDKQPSGTLPTFDTIFGATDQAANETTVYTDPVKYDNMSRFQVLKDVCIEANPEAILLGDKINNRFKFDEFIKLGNRETVFSADNAPATIADISTGGLYVFFRAQAATTDVNEWAISSNSIARLRYSD